MESRTCPVCLGNVGKTREGVLGKGLLKLSLKGRSHLPHGGEAKAFPAECMHRHRDMVELACRGKMCHRAQWSRASDEHRWQAPATMEGLEYNPKEVVSTVPTALHTGHKVA